MEIIKQIDDLTKEKWNFTYIDNTIYLESYYLEKRESKRHRNYKKIKVYERLSERDSNINESEVLLNDELKQEALKQFVSQIKVIKWSERKNKM
jgi:hypothetical protein